jgi:hypothetical protein
LFHYFTSVSYYTPIFIKKKEFFLERAGKRALNKVPGQSFLDVIWALNRSNISLTVMPKLAEKLLAKDSPCWISRSLSENSG